MPAVEESYDEGLEEEATAGERGEGEGRGTALREEALSDTRGAAVGEGGEEAGAGAGEGGGGGAGTGVRVSVELPSTAIDPDWDREAWLTEQEVGS